MVARCGALLFVMTLLTSAAAAAPAQVGRFRLVTYNVAGLPEGISASHPQVNMPRIGRLLADYDVVLVQEDFAYARELRAAIKARFASPPWPPGPRLDFGDGLNQFAKFPFSNYTRETWATCHGVVDAWCDCRAPKGFTYSRMTLPNRARVDVYDVHLDAGDGPGDRQARDAQLEQLARAIELRSTGVAVLVAGDTNIPSSQRAVLERLLARSGLRDACSELSCAAPGLVDRVLYRSSRELRLQARSWQLDARFVDDAGQPLSDHPAVAVEFAWTKNSAPASLAGAD